MIQVDTKEILNIWCQKIHYAIRNNSIDSIYDTRYVTIFYMGLEVPQFIISYLSNIKVNLKSCIVFLRHLHDIMLQI